MMYQRARFQNECSEYDSRTGLPVVGRDLQAALDAYDVVDGSNLGYISLSQFRTLCRRINIRVDDFAFVSACVAREFLINNINNNKDEKRNSPLASPQKTRHHHDDGDDDALLPPPASSSHRIPANSQQVKSPSSSHFGQERLQQLQRIHEIRARSRQYFAKEYSVIEDEKKRKKRQEQQQQTTTSTSPPIPPALIPTSPPPLFSSRPKSGSNSRSRPTSAQSKNNNNINTSRSLLFTGNNNNG